MLSRIGNSQRFNFFASSKWLMVNARLRFNLWFMALYQSIQSVSHLFWSGFIWFDFTYNSSRL